MVLSVARTISEKFLFNCERHTSDASNLLGESFQLNLQEKVEDYYGCNIENEGHLCNEEFDVKQYLKRESYNRSNTWRSVAPFWIEDTFHSLKPHDKHTSSK